MRIRVLITCVVIGLATACGGSPVEEDAGVDETELNEQLIEASWADDVGLARDLIAQGADVNFQDDTRQSAYLIATSEGYVELLDLTFEHGADVTSLDGFNGTGLIRAAERGHHEIVARLLETNVDVDHVNNLGWTALHEAILLGDGSERYVETVRLLLDGGADPNLATGDGQDPLVLAENRDQDEVAELLRAAR